MGSLGDGDDEIKPIKRNSTVYISDTETQDFDSQFSPSLSGEKLEDGDSDELRFLQSTLPFDDTVPLEDGFETQVVNLGGATQVVNLDGETQVLDDPDCVENMGTQIFDECDNEVVVDSDGEDTDRTEVLSDTEGLSNDDSGKKVGGQPVDGENMQCASLCKQGEKGFVEGPDSLTDEQRSSELHVSTATPLDQGTTQPKAGSVRGGFTSVRAASLRASGLAARRMAFKVANSGSCSILSNSLSSKQHALEDNGISVIRDSSEVDEELDLGNCNEKLKGLRNEIKCRVGSSAVRKLFTDDMLAENEGTTKNINNADGGADLPQLPACDNTLAGLSYVDSQEPGESSQANALDFVDRFLKVNIVELDREVDHRKTTRGKSNPVSSSKGPQSLAKRANLRSAAGVAGIFDWDDSREDEGGGDLFRKRKAEFFDSRGRGRRSFSQPRKPRHLDLKESRVDEIRSKEEQLSIHNKIMGPVHSDSRLMLHNSKENDKTVHAPDLKIKKKLVQEFDEQLYVDSSNGQLEATCTKMDMPDMMNVGFDTQMAAEAMEALFYGADVANHDANDAYQRTQNISKGSAKGERNNKACSKQNSLQKRECPDLGVITRQSKQTKRIGATLSKEISVSSRKRSKSVRKQSDTELVKSKPKRAKSNAEEHLATNGSENLDKIPSKIIRQRKAEGASERYDFDEIDRRHGTATSSGRISVKKRCLQGELGTFTPIACRTRQSMVVNHLKMTEDASNDSREEMNDLKRVGALKDKRKRSTGVDAFKMSDAKEKSSKLGSYQFGELENVKPSEHKQSDPKSTAITSGVETDSLSYPRGRRTHRNMSVQVNGTGNLDGPSKLSVGQEANGQSVTRQKRSRSNARSTCLDLDIKRKTRSSYYARPVSSSLDRQSEQRLLQNEKPIPEDLVVSKSCKHSDRKNDAYSTSSAEGVEANSKLEGLPRERCKQSDSVCTTPVNCTTPINAASPICMGDEYLKQSCRKNLSRSSLMKEINSLGATGPELTPIKDSRRRRDMANVRVLFSHHLDEDIIKQQKKILARLGASIATSMSDATHFITDKFVRTRNMLEAIAFGKPVVTHLWLESCGQASCFIDEKNYILRDAKKEKEFGFSMPVSLARACQRPLLQGQRVLITPNTKPGKELIASLVKAVHGQALERIGRSALKDDKLPDDLLVLSCEEDYSICVPFLEKGAAVYSSELLLDGIVTQKLEFARHRLFVDHVKRTRSTIWLRKDGNQFLPVTNHK